MADLFNFLGVVTGTLADKSVYADYRTRHRSIVHVYATFLNTSYCNGLSENGKGQGMVSDVGDVDGLEVWQGEEDVKECEPEA